MTNEPRGPDPYGVPGEPPLRNPFRPPPGGRGDLREKGWIPWRWLALWWFLMPDLPVVCAVAVVL